MTAVKSRGPASPAAGWALAAAGAGGFLAALDQTAVVTALPPLFRDIELPVTRLNQGSWVVTGYLLGYTAAMPLMGKVSDVYGHARVYLLSMLVFLIGSAVVAGGDTLAWVVGGRVVQAVGGGALVPVTMALARERLPAARGGLAIGLVAAIAEGGAVLGPLYGGVITEYLGWRWIFWINLPLGVALALPVLALWRSVRRAPAPVDYLGGALLAGSMAALALGLSEEAVLPSGAVWRPALLAAAAALLVVFLVWEGRARAPLFPRRWLRLPSISAASGANLLVGGALILALVNIPLMTDTIMGQPPLEGGLRLLRFTVMMPVGALAGAALYQRWGYRLPMAVGLGLAALGFGLLARWPLHVGDPRMTLELMVGGLGFGLVITPITASVLDSVRADQQATAAALVTVMRMVGMTVGLSAMSSWGQNRFNVLAGQVPTTLEATAYRDAIAHATLAFFHEVFFVAMVVCLAALLPAMLMTRRTRPGA